MNNMSDDWDEDDTDVCCAECKCCGYHKPSCSQYNEDDD